MVISQDKFKEMMLAFNTYQDMKALNLAQELEFENDTVVSNEAKRILGSIHFQKAKYSESADYWQDLVNSSDRPEDWLSVVTATTLSKDFEKAEGYFEKALQLFNVKTRDGEITAPVTGTGRISSPYLCHYYCLALCEAGAYERGLKTFFRLGEIYKKIKITDDHFLITRGIPFFTEFLDLAEKIVVGSPKLTHWVSYLDELRAGVDELGQASIDALKKKLAT